MRRDEAQDEAARLEAAADELLREGRPNDAVRAHEQAEEYRRVAGSPGRSFPWMVLVVVLIALAVLAFKVWVLSQ